MSSKAFRTLSNGNKIPWIGFGTGTALYGRSADRSVLTALEAGFIHIDSAEMYGNEASVGQAIKEFLSSPGISRDSLFVTTKLNTLPSGRTVRDSIKESLRKLQIDYLDLYLIHTPVPHQGRLKEVWKQMEEVYREGLAKNIGVSNFRLKDFAEFIDAVEVVPVVNQIEFNPYLLKATEPLLALHKKYNILTVSYGGLVPLSRKTGGPLDDIIPTIRERLSKDTGKQVSDGQVLLKWLKAHDALPITTSSKKDRLVNLLETPDLPDLSAEEVKELDEAGKKIHHRNYMQHMER